MSQTTVLLMSHLTSSNFQFYTPIGYHIPGELANPLVNCWLHLTLFIMERSYICSFGIVAYPRFTFSLSTKMRISSALPFLDFLNTFIHHYCFSYSITSVQGNYFPIKYEDNQLNPITFLFSQFPEPLDI